MYNSRAKLSSSIARSYCYMTSNEVQLSESKVEISRGRTQADNAARISEYLRPALDLCSRMLLRQQNIKNDENNRN